MMALEPTEPNAWPAPRSYRRRQTTVAYVLWVILAGVIWNVVFDRVLVLAGRQYVHAASAADQRANSPVPPVLPVLPVLIDPWMRDARRRAVRLATMVAVPVVVAGVMAIRFASRRQTGRDHPRLSRGT